ncbi:50S ribosomal protein L22, partial [Candidatus Micrarchaeota archaeon]
MVEFGYGYRAKEGEKVARAQAYDIDASYKDLCEVCTDVRGTLAEPALTRLDLIAKGQVAVRYHQRHGKRTGDRRELGGKKGRYPKKAARLVRKVLENALANATALGIQVPYIAHISANKHRTYPRLAPKGRAMRHDYETARIEIILKESEVERSEAAKKKPKLLK